MKKTATNPEKAQLRQKIRKQRKTCAPEWITATSQLIQQQVIALRAFQTAQSIASYMAMPLEVQTQLLHAACFEQKKTLCVPCRKKNTFAWAQLRENTALTTMHTAGIKEPADPEWLNAIQPDLILVPVLAVDHVGHRLGHGGGHYDRLLATHTGFKLALAFNFQYLASIPHEPWDILMDAAATQTGVKPFKTGK